MTRLMEPRALRRRQIDRALATAQQAPRAVPRGGWIRAIRNGLGMTTEQLARRMGLAKATVSRIESREAEGRVTLQTLARAADALECDVVYLLVPRQGTLEATLTARAHVVAKAMVERASHTMALEDQHPGEHPHEEAIARLADELIRSGEKALWEPG